MESRIRIFCIHMLTPFRMLPESHVELQGLRCEGFPCCSNCAKSGDSCHFGTQIQLGSNARHPPRVREPKTIRRSRVAVRAAGSGPSTLPAAAQTADILSPLPIHPHHWRPSASAPVPPAAVGYRQPVYPPTLPSSTPARPESMPRTFTGGPALQDSVELERENTDMSRRVDAALSDFRVQHTNIDCFNLRARVVRRTNWQKIWLECPRCGQTSDRVDYPTDESLLYFDYFSSPYARQT